MPRKFLLSPLLDATLTNPNITKTLEENDILVSRFGVHQLMKSWTNDLPLSDARISPLYGTLKGCHLYICMEVAEILSRHACIYSCSRGMWERC